MFRYVVAPILLQVAVTSLHVQQAHKTGLSRVADLLYAICCAHSSTVVDLSHSGDGAALYAVSVTALVFVVVALTNLALRCTLDLETQ